MSGWITIACPACARTVKVPDNRPILACGQCGTELVMRRTGEVVSLAPLTEALSGIDIESPANDDSTRAQARATCFDLLSEIDELWLQRERDLNTSLRLLAIGCFGVLIAVSVEAGWLRIPALLIAVSVLPGLYGLYDHFIGKSKDAKRDRLEQALIAIWPALSASRTDIESERPVIPPHRLN
jgi:hypothetical protein